MTIPRCPISSPHSATDATNTKISTSAQISKYLHIAIARSNIRTILGTTMSSLVQRLHQYQIAKLSCLVWFHVSHGTARNQSRGGSIASHVVRLFSEDIHQLFFQPPRILTAFCCGLIRGLSSAAPALRSEEHTSELQSLMRISYAV